MQSFADVLQIGFLKNFAIFTEKNLRWSLQHWCFPLKFVKLLRTSFLQNIPFVAASEHVMTKEAFSLGYSQ